MELVLAILKFSGIILTGTFGAIGVAVEYKDAKTGQMTKWGRRALIGVIFTSVVAVVSSAVEMMVKQEDAAQAAEKAAKQTLQEVERANKILSEVNRAVHPIEGVEITAWVTIPMEDDRLAPYYNLLVEETKKFVAQFSPDRESRSNGILNLTSFGWTDEGTIVPRTVEVKEGSILAPWCDRPQRARRSPCVNDDGIFVPWRVLIEEGSIPALWRDQTQTALLYELLRRLRVGFAVYRSAISPSKFQPYSHFRAGGGDPDLRISAHPAELDIRHHVGADLGEVDLIGWNMTMSREHWQVSGKIVSIPDLYGSQVFFWLDNRRRSWGRDPTKDKALFDLRKTRSLDRIELRISNREFRFTDDHFVRHVDKEGHPFWEMTFPANPQEFADSTHRQV